MHQLRELETMLSQGKISRRDFLIRVSALGLTAAMAPILPFSSASAAVPNKGGRFRQGWSGGSTTDSLDPATLPDNFIYSLNWQLRNNLVEVDYKGIPRPELAENFESSPDATKWIFNLRKGVEFHNGKSLTAEDVVYSINYHKGKDSKSVVKSLVDSVKEIKADGKYTVIFSLTEGNADFPYVMSDFHFTISPANTKGKAWEKGIGTGGYILRQWEPGVRAFAKRNPNYWKEGRAHFDEAELINIKDVNTRTNSLKTGQIDHMNRCELKTVHLLEKTSNIQVIRSTGTFHYYMPMFVDAAPFDNNDVRLALKYAVDRENMVKVLLRGYGTVGNDHPVANTQRYHADELPQRRYDPDKAKYHLKKAGLAGHTFKLHSADMRGMLDVATLYQEHAEKAGVKIELVRESSDGYWSNVWMKKPFVTSYHNGRPTEDMVFTTTYAAESSWNDSHWKDERFNKLLKEARAELDEAKRREMYVEMQKICRDKGGSVVPMFEDYVEAVNDKVKFKNIAGNFPSDGLRAAERWWFAS